MNATRCRATAAHRLFVEGEDGRYRVIGIESHTNAQPGSPMTATSRCMPNSIMAEMRALAAGQTGGQPPQQPSK
jgi:hypothetical protein